MNDRPQDEPAYTNAAKPTPTVEFRTEPELTDAAARALLTLLQASTANRRQGPVESTDA